MNRNDKNNNAKKKRTQTQKSIKEEKNNKLPLYKIFMDENNAKKNKKFHLMKNPTSSMDKEISNHYKKQKAIEEILEILKYNQSDKDIRSEISPFKPMQEPKKIFTKRKFKH